MSQINYDRDNISQNIATKISEAIGVTSFSQSSKLKLLTDIFSNEITNLAEAYDIAVDGLYAETAIGEDLDIKGAQYGIYRKSRNSLYIDRTDGIAIIRPKNKGETFGDSIREPIVINRGERLDVGSSFFLILSEDLYIIPSDILVLVSGTLISEDKSGFIININDTYEMHSRTRYDDSLSTLLLEFLKPISIDGTAEDDDTFRTRVILARDGNNIATIPAIEGEILSLPDLSGFSLLENKRGSGSLDIGITTITLQDTSVDEEIDSMLGLLETGLLLIAPVGVDILIYKPEKINLLIEYSTNKKEISDDNIISAVIDSFRMIYTYNSINTISTRELEKQIDILLPESDVLITTLSLFDPTINAIISTSSDTVMAPPSYFIYLEKNSIVREPVDG